jgi:hypothetical protein
MSQITYRKFRLPEHLLREMAALLLFSVVLLIVTGCGTIRHLKYPNKHTYFKVSEKNTRFTPEYPKSFTVYPFKNLTWDKTAAIRAQRTTAMAFSLIGPVSSIPETADLAAKPYSYEDAIKVAKKQKSDAVIIGEVITQDSVFLILWSYSYVRMKLTIYDTKDGTVLWTGKSWSMTNDLGGLLFWVPVPSLSGVLKHFYWSRVVNDLYFRIALDAIHTLRPNLTKLDDKK